MDSLLEAVEKLGPCTVAVVGLAKNCGKTTAFNHLLKGYADRNAALAVTSAGRDGEGQDALTFQSKPAIHLSAGTLAATAEGTLDRWDAPYKIITHLGIDSALGEILLVEATGPGAAELAGPPILASVADAVRKMKKLGAKRVLIDGAFDRIAVGHPGLADAVVLAAGAVLAGSSLSVARIVAEKTELLSVGPPPGDIRQRLVEAVEELGSGTVVVREDFQVEELPESALMGPLDVAEIASGARWLVCGGAVTYELIETLLAGGVRADLVARDATRIFVGANCLRRWREAERKMYVLSPVSLAAVVTNPHNPTGQDLDPTELIDDVAARVKGFPVFDVTADLSRNAPFSFR